MRPGITVALVALFLVHAISYWHFFVDDEAITLVYARSLIEGHGLQYSALEGPVEGYSNFLHVFVMAGLLALVRGTGVDPVWVFAAGKVVSLACGAAIVALTLRVCRRLQLPAFATYAAGLMVALAAPLAVWRPSWPPPASSFTPGACSTSVNCCRFRSRPRCCTSSSAATPRR